MPEKARDGGKSPLKLLNHQESLSTPQTYHNGLVQLFILSEKTKKKPQNTHNSGKSGKKSSSFYLKTDKDEWYDELKNMDKSLKLTMVSVARDIIEERESKMVKVERLGPIHRQW